MSVYINISNEIDLLDEIYYLGEDNKIEIVDYILDDLDKDHVFNLLLNHLKQMDINKLKFEQIKEACNVNDLFND